MADDEKPKLTEWNLRDFPLDLKLTIQQKKLDWQRASGKRAFDSEIVAYYLRKGLATDEQETKKKKL